MIRIDIICCHQFICPKFTSYYFAAYNDTITICVSHRMTYFYKCTADKCLMVNRKTAGATRDDVGAREMGGRASVLIIIH